MKKHTIVLIILCIVSLVSGVVFSVAGLISLRRVGMTLIKDAISDSEIVWHFDDGLDQDGESVRVRIPFIDVQVIDGHVQVSLPGIDVEVEEGRSNVRIGSFQVGDDMSETEETIATEELNNEEAE